MDTEFINYLEVACKETYDFEDVDMLINNINWDKYPNGIPDNEDFFGEANDKIEKGFYPILSQSNVSAEHTPSVAVDVSVVDTPKQDPERRSAPVDTPRKKPRISAPKKPISYCRDFIDPRSPKTVFVVSYGMDTNSNPNMEAFQQESPNGEKCIVPVGYSSYFSMYRHQWFFHVRNDNDKLSFEVVSERTENEPDVISSGPQDTPSFALRQCIVKFLARYPESSMGCSGEQLRADTISMLGKVNARLYLGLYGEDMQREFNQANLTIL